MKTFITTLILVSVSYFSYSQNFETLSFGTDTTLDIVTWNIETFPKNGNTTTNYVRDILSHLEADVIAIQEVDDITVFNTLVSQLTGYTGELSTSYFAGLAYIYNPSTIEFKDYYEIYTTSPYWNSFPRAPKVLEFTYKGNEFAVINNHLKCCGDGYLDTTSTDDEEHRRYMAAILLKLYIDQNLFDKHVIVTGDMNDELTDAYANNIFRHFLDNPGSYSFADMTIATGASAGWSYPSWPSHLDHFLINQELYDDMENPNSLCEVIKVDSYFTSWTNYDNNVTDHRPVGLRIDVNEHLGISEQGNVEQVVVMFPNPVNDFIRIESRSAAIESVFICDASGRRLATVVPGDAALSASIDLSALAAGLYFAELSLIDGSRHFRTLVKK